MMDEICDKDNMQLLIDFMTDVKKIDDSNKRKAILFIIDEAAKHYQKDLVPYLEKIL